MTAKDVSGRTVSPMSMGALRTGVRALNSGAFWALAAVLTVATAVIHMGSLRNSDQIRPGSDIANDLLFGLRMDHGYMTLHGYHSRVGDYHPGPFYEWTLWLGHRIGESLGFGGYVGAYLLYLSINVGFLILAGAGLAAALRTPRAGICLVLAPLLFAVWAEGTRSDLINAVFRYITGSAVAPLALLAALTCTWAWSRGVRWAPIAVVFSAGAAFQLFFPVAVAAAPFFAAPFAWVLWRLKQHRIDRYVTFTALVGLAMIAPMVARLLLVGPITLIKRYTGGYARVPSNSSAETVRQVMFEVWGLSWPYVLVVLALAVALPVIFAVTAPVRRREAVLLLVAVLWLVAVAAWEFRGHSEGYTMLWTATVPTILLATVLTGASRKVPVAALGLVMVASGWAIIPKTNDDSTLVNGSGRGAFTLASSYRTVPEVDAILDKIRQASGQNSLPVEVVEVVSNDREGSLVIFNSTEPVITEMYRRGVDFCLASPVQHILPAELYCPQGSTYRKLIVVRMTEMAKPETLATYSPAEFDALGHVNGVLFLLQRGPVTPDA
jgi:hypothetical protein